MRRSVLILLLAVAAGGRGKKQPLRAADNQPLPVKPATAAVRPTPTDILNRGPQAAPLRFNELVTKSQVLQSDRFDMPPPG